MVSISEAQRFDMHRGLKVSLGEQLGDLVMEHLPPGGWGDIASRHDVHAVRKDIETVRQDVSRLDRTLKWVIGLGVTVSLGLFALQAQILLVVSQG
jgi:hypothetical protein